MGGTAEELPFVPVLGRKGFFIAQKVQIFQPLPHRLLRKNCRFFPLWESPIEGVKT